MAWSLACEDWQERIQDPAGTLVPDLTLDDIRAGRAVEIFDSLRLPDVAGLPLLREAAGDWFRDIVRALHGSIDKKSGKRHIREVFLLVPKKNSKAVELDTLIATPSGFVRMGDVAVGDAVLDSDGKITRVTEKSPVFLGHECFEVKFSTGEAVTCDGDHLWVTDAHLDRERHKTRKQDNRHIPRPSTKTTREIAASLKVKSGKFLINNHRTALCGNLDLPEAALPIPPYVLGLWLGDGAANAAVITSGLEDVDHIVEQIAATGHSVQIKGYRYSRGVSVRLSIGEPGNRNDRLKYRFSRAASELGLLGNKHIPQVYIRSSREQRLALLRGLMDSDGSISKVGQASFTTTLPSLRDDVLELINSLGFKGATSEHRASLNGKDCGPVWNIRFWPFDSVPVFTIARKLERQRATSAANAARSKTRQIVDVRPVPSVPVQCIAVESATHQYLITRSLIPTHNTTGGAALMLTSLLMNKVPKAEFLLIAPTQPITEIAFNQVAGMIEAEAGLVERLHIQHHLKKITYLPTGATLQVKSFDPNVLTGVKPAGVLVDELHVVSGNAQADRVIGQLRGGLISQKEGFLVFITTQSERPPAGVFKAELNKARDIRDGKRAGAMLPVLYEFPDDIRNDEELWGNPDCWWMVTPNRDRSITIDRLKEEFQTAKDTGEEEFRRWASQHLNIEIGMGLRSNGWAGAQHWKRGIERGLTLDAILDRSEVITVGTDGGGLDDLLGLAVIGREKLTKRWLAWTHAFISPEGLERRKANGPQYQDFRANGDLTLVAQLPEDIAALIATVEKVKASGLLYKVGCDSAGLGLIVDALAEIGISEANDNLVGVRQGFGLMGAIKAVERKLIDGTFMHGGQPMMTWCAGNAITQPTPTGMRIVRDASGYGKIDPLMALFDAAELMTLNPAPIGGPSIYETRSLLMV
jgi:phage terminase large subunit-like protein